jgi:hypothetical protein
MRVQRSIELTRDLLLALEHPGIVSVEGFTEPNVKGFAGLKVTFTDASAVYMRVVGSTGPAGTSFGEPETIPFPDWRIPSDLKERAWPHGALTATR